MNVRISALLFALPGVLYAAASLAQSTVNEDFTQTTTNNNWFYTGGACLTASSSAGTGSEFTATTTGTAGVVPGCTSIRSKSDAYGGETLVGGYNGTFPDPTGNGALRFTNGCISSGCGSGGYDQFGAIISGNTFPSSAGVQVTFKTVTYRGNSGGSAGDGADGISFFLQDATYNPGIGQYGGSLAYSCSNSNPNFGFGGMVGGYIGLGIDEYGNFLNGGTNSLGEVGSSNTGADNTATGGLYKPNRIGMRGAGNVAWSWLNAHYPSYYPSTLTAGYGGQQYAAVQATCSTGTLWNFANPYLPVNTNSTGTAPNILKDYAAIPNAYTVLSGVTIANEYGTNGFFRSPYPLVTSNNGGTPILYKVKITAAGLLTLRYSYNGGNYITVLNNQSILSSNGALPANIRFGFAGSTGGSSNIHEVLCFKAAAADTSNSSATSNQTQSSRVTSSTQAYFSYYDPNDWTGRLTANAISSDSYGNLTIAPVATWDASCVLTGVGTGTCPTTTLSTPVNAENWQATGGTAGVANRAILTWNYNSLTNTGVGVPFETVNLSVAQQAALNVGDANGITRLNFLRGDRSNELTTNSSGVSSGLYRDRDYVLGDIVDSSPVAVGQPVLPYAATWKDKLFSSATMPENVGAQSYSAFVTAETNRENMVYVGANDGMVHGFRAGNYSTSNPTNNPLGATNDGTEMLAYVPGAVLNSASASTGATPCLSTAATQTAVQNIHGVTPVIGSFIACTQAALDFSNPQYGHNFFVNAPPASGDLFYGASSSTEQWHTWLVGGLGAGGGAIYAIDVTTPGNFSEGNASSLVIGEWTAQSISCSGTSNCGNNLGNTYGTPLIRRMHNGMWAIIFGNGFSSSSGDAGIYVMTVTPSTGATTVYYLSTGMSGTNDGIAYVSSADLDGDHVADYLYAGDLLGNVWRFDVTSNSAATWGTSGTVYKVFAAGAAQPITSSLLVAAVTGNGPGTQVMIGFGTGQKIPPNNVTGVQYASAQQAIYGVWDSNFAAWNLKSTASQYASLTATGTALTSTNLTSQTLTIVSATNTLDITSNTICWAGTSGCTGTAAKYGWYASLVGTNEQIIYNPQLIGTAFSVNSIIPANNTVISCNTANDAGYTYAVSLATGSLPSTNGSGTGGGTNNTSTIFINTTSTNATTGVTTTVANTDSHAVGILTNATGTSTQMTTSTNTASSGITPTGTGSSVTCSLAGNCTTLPTSLVTYPGPFSSVSGCSAGDTYLVYQTTTAGAQATRVSPSCPLTGSRTTRTQVR